jgi:hypothetical protein
MDSLMHLSAKILILVASVAVLLVVTEAALQIYVATKGGRGNWLSVDRGVGWRPLPSLKITRLNAAGQEWRIETDHVGQRILGEPANPKRTILILGDSFAFGEGVNIEDRFDQRIRSALPDAGIINTGVMAFGTDQQYLAGKPYFSQLAGNDIVLVLFNRSDFFEVQRRRFTRRAKPYFEKIASGYELRSPEISMLDLVRDRFLLGKLLGQPADTIDTAHLDNPNATEIIRTVLTRIRNEIPRGVPVVLAYNGDRSDHPLANAYSGAQFCDLVDLCIDLHATVASSPTSFLPDGHWSAQGHAAAGDTIANGLRELPIK